MHSDDPYTIVPPQGCRVATPDGVQDGLVIGERGSQQLVLHGSGRDVMVSWTPSIDVWVLEPSDWAPWSSAIAANA